jgi:hypothetical protein
MKNLFQAAAKHESMVKARELTRLQMAVTAQTVIAQNGQTGNGQTSNGQISNGHHNGFDMAVQACDAAADEREPAVSYNFNNLNMSVDFNGKCAVQLY